MKFQSIAIENKSSFYCCIPGGRNGVINRQKNFILFVLPLLLVPGNINKNDSANVVGKGFEEIRKYYPIFKLANE